MAGEKDCQYGPAYDSVRIMRKTAGTGSAFGVPAETPAAAEGASEGICEIDLEDPETEYFLSISESAILQDVVTDPVIRIPDDCF